jgi:hypothetical protein
MSKNMAMSHTVRTVEGMTNVIPRNNKMTKRKKKTGRFTPASRVWPMRIPMMVQHSAGTRGRENMRVTRYLLQVIRYSIGSSCADAITPNSPSRYLYLKSMYLLIKPFMK